jgi:hypothetical protein
MAMHASWHAPAADEVKAGYDRRNGVALSCCHTHATHDGRNRLHAASDEPALNDGRSPVGAVKAKLGARLRDDYAAADCLASFGTESIVFRICEAIW